MCYRSSLSGHQSAAYIAKPRTVRPWNYLQIYSTDFLYAAMNGPTTVMEGNCGSVNVSAQEELNLASKRLLEISEPPPFFP